MTRSQAQDLVDLLKGLGVEDVPSAHSILTLPPGFPIPAIKKVQVESSVGKPRSFSMIPPSESLKYLVGQKHIYENLARLPTAPSSILDSFAGTEREKELFTGFKTATIQLGNTTYFIGNIIQFRLPSDSPTVEPHYGKIRHIFQAAKQRSSIQISVSYLFTQQDLQLPRLSHNDLNNPCLSVATANAAEQLNTRIRV